MSGISLPMTHARRQSLRQITVRNLSTNNRNQNHSRVTAFMLLFPSKRLLDYSEVILSTLGKSFWHML